MSLESCVLSRLHHPLTMNLDLTRIPFSRFGSYMAFSILTEAPEQPAGLYLRSVRGPATGGRPMQGVLHMTLLREGQTLSSHANASFTCLEMSAKDAQMHLCLPTAETARIRLQGAALRLQMPSIGTYDNIIPGRNNTWLLTANSVVESKLTFSALKGRIEVDAPWEAEHSRSISITLLPDEDGVGEFAIDESTINWPRIEHLSSFEECLQQVQTELDAYTAALPEVPPIYAETRDLAGYVLWSCTVAAKGHLERPAIFASKNGMIGVWSWDHAFHVLALAEGLPELAWAQMMVLFDLQDGSGALPDLANDRLLSWSFCKPPVHGWILSRLWESGLLTGERLAEIYPLLCRWTDWWLFERDENGDGFPQCNHGNDGGWDNSTVFAVRPPVETPDICTYLVLQMDFLAQAAERLGKPDEASLWSARAQDLTGRMLERFWREDHFVAVQVSESRDIESESLLLYIPLLLGERLPLEVRERMIARLKEPGVYLTGYGLATESLKSPYYRSKGYWRGPVWPAPTLILIDALTRCGEVEFAGQLRRRFCELVKEQGMAENFDAITGEGYHDFHFSWTAGIFLTLANEMIRE